MFLKWIEGSIKPFWKLNHIDGTLVLYNSRRNIIQNAHKPKENCVNKTIYSNKFALKRNENQQINCERRDLSLNRYTKIRVRLLTAGHIQRRSSFCIGSKKSSSVNPVFKFCLLTKNGLTKTASIIHKTTAFIITRNSEWRLWLSTCATDLFGSVYVSFHSNS